LENNGDEVLLLSTKLRAGILLVCGVATSPACLLPSEAEARSRRRAAIAHDIVGTISWYGGTFHGRRTASGERYDMRDLTAAHRHLPLSTRVRVTNLENGRSVTLRINDRGPYAGDRVLDVSRAGAEQLGFSEKGVTRARVTVLDEAAPRF
jgi:rare lipoprotein A